MPVINVLLTLGYVSCNYTVLIVFLSVSILAYSSWKFVEKPALLLKNRYP